MPELSADQFSLVYNVMSLCIASMFAGALFLFLSRGQVAPKYRPALLISALVPTIACYHYVRILSSFDAAYEIQVVDDVMSHVASGQPFNDAYRYADWLLTVPLLVIELVAVLALAKSESRSLSIKLGVAAALMIILGYPGEVAQEAGTAWMWWVASMVPFLYIMGTLFTSFRSAVERQPATVQPLVKTARGLIVLTWSFYPIAYIFGIGGAGNGEVALQVGYTIADITAKVGLGLYIYAIARAKSDADGFEPGVVDGTAIAQTASDGSRGGSNGREGVLQN